MANKVDERAELLLLFQDVLYKNTLVSRCIVIAVISKLVSFFILHTVRVECI